MFKIHLAAFYLCALLLLAACAAPQLAPTIAPTSESKVGGVLSLALGSDPDTLDLQQTSNPDAYTVFGQIYETLVYQDLDGSYKGLLADKWTVSPDNKSITFTLRPGIKFTDGSPFNAAAVKFTFERLKQVGAKSPIYETFKNVASMDAPDDTTFRLTLTEPYAPILHDLGTSYAGILSPTAVQAANGDISHHAVGTGSYSLKNWQVGQTIVLERNPDYNHPPAFFSNRGAPYIQELQFKIIPQYLTQRAALETGEISMLPLEATDVTKYAADPRFKLYDILTQGVTYLGFDTKRPPFDNVKLRQALSHAVNKQEIVQTVFNGTLARAACCQIAESVQGYDARLSEFELKYDAGLANKMLDDLGYLRGPDGLRRTPEGKAFQPVLYTSTSPLLAQVATLLQAQFKAVGVDLQIKQLEPAQLLAVTPKAEHDLYLNGYVWDEPDLFSIFLSCDRVTSSNRALYCNQDLEKLIKAGRTELDQTKRNQIYFDAQKLTLEQAPWQPLYMAVNKVAVTSKLQGLRQTPSGDLLYQDAFIK